MFLTMFLALTANLKLRTVYGTRINKALPACELINGFKKEDSMGNKEVNGL